MVSRVVSLFLLSQIFLIIHHKPLVVTILKLLINFEGNQIMPSGFNHESSVAIEDNITDEEKEQRISSSTAVSSNSTSNLTSHLETILDCLDPAENDYEALFGLSLLYAMGQNRGKQASNSYGARMHSKWRNIQVSMKINLFGIRLNGSRF